MEKLSKSDLPDYNDTYWEWKNSRPKSQHFAVGTAVTYQGRRYIVSFIAYSVPGVILRDEAGKLHSIRNPYFMQWQSRPLDNVLTMC
jgi:hypothetical protein